MNQIHNKIKIEFAKEFEVDELVRLSKAFEQEKCCNGIIADDKDFFIKKKVAVAKIDTSIVGYCYGIFEIKTKDTSKYKKGQKSFYVEELYVDARHRNKEIGRKLFCFIERYAKENGCDFIETTAVSKDYKRLLSFYIDKLDMDFWSAEIIKKIK